MNDSDNPHQGQAEAVDLAHLQAELCLLKHRGGECKTDHPDLFKFRGFSAQDFDRYFSIFSQRCPLLGRDVRNTGENRLKSENVSFTYLVVLTDVSAFLFPFFPVPVFLFLIGRFSCFRCEYDLCASCNSKRLEATTILCYLCITRLSIAFVQIIIKTIWLKLFG